MSTHEFEFDAFADNFELVTDDPSDWPSLAVTLEIRWHGAEPDVGIFERQPELTDATYYIGDESFASEDAFVAAIYERIGDEIEETVEAVAKVVRDQVNEWESEVEDDG